MDGTHAELIAVPRANVYPIPDGISFEEAAAFPLVFETAYRMLVTKAGLREGEWVLVWGIGGGLATAANAIARALGARTIVTASSTEKLARVEAEEGRPRHRRRDRKSTRLKLQSRLQLVCRLLLEKKKKKNARRQNDDIRQ